MPTDPDVSIHDLARSCTTRSKLHRNAVNGAIRQALTPPPISARAIARPTTLLASATLPSTATPRKTSCTRFGPRQSSAELR